MRSFGHHPVRRAVGPAFACVLLAGGLSCGGGSSGGSASDAGDASVVGAPPPNTDSCPVVVSSSACDTTQRPILFVHGTYSSGTDFAHMAALLGSNGFCQDR